MNIWDKGWKYVYSKSYNTVAVNFSLKQWRYITPIEESAIDRYKAKSSVDDYLDGGTILR